MTTQNEKAGAEVLAEMGAERDPESALPWMTSNDFPTFETCNPNCPEEAFLPTYVGMPGLKGAPLLFPIEYLKQVSRRQWDCGMRPNPELRVIKYQRPRSSDPHWLAAPGVWVDINDPDRSNFDLKEFVASLPYQTRVELAEALGLSDAADIGNVQPDTRVIQDPHEKTPAPPEGASVSNDPTGQYDPTVHTVKDVLAYMRMCTDPLEVEQIQMIESVLGQGRINILKYKHPLQKPVQP